MRHYEASQLTNTFLKVPPPASAGMIKPRDACYRVCWLRCRRALCTGLPTRGTRGQVAHPQFPNSTSRLCSRENKEDKDSSASPALVLLQDGVFPEALLIFCTQPQSFTLICKCYTALWRRNQQLCHPDVIPSPLALFMCGSECEEEKRVLLLLLLCITTATQISLWTSFDCSFTAAKMHLYTSGNILNPGGS